jgi:hypothetical protein
MSIGVRYVSDSGNSKISGSKKVDATYASIKSSCPKDCSLMNEGCYAQTAYVGITVHKLDAESSGLTALETAREEARAIDNAYNGGAIPVGRDLRLHVSGDSRTIKGTKLINNAVKRWKSRGGNDCWSYTHAWQHVPRQIWSNVSILASISSIKEVILARKQGYAPAIVVDSHIDDKAYTLADCDVKWIPCPSQTRDVACSDCRLCFNANRLFENNYGIAFAAHGNMKENIKRRLKVLNG